MKALNGPNQWACAIDRDGFVQSIPSTLGISPVESIEGVVACEVQYGSCQFGPTEPVKGRTEQRLLASLRTQFGF